MGGLEGRRMRKLSDRKEGIRAAIRMLGMPVFTSSADGALDSIGMLGCVSILHIVRLARIF